MLKLTFPAFAAALLAPEFPALALLTLTQLGIAGLMVLQVLIVADSPPRQPLPPLKRR